MKRIFFTLLLSFSLALLHAQPSIEIKNVRYATWNKSAARWEWSGWETQRFRITTHNNLLLVQDANQSVYTMGKVLKKVDDDTQNLNQREATDERGKRCVVTFAIRKSDSELFYTIEYKGVITLQYQADLTTFRKE